jgi:hypothetical protein
MGSPFIKAVPPEGLLLRKGVGGLRDFAREKTWKKGGDDTSLGKRSEEGKGS